MPDRASCPRIDGTIGDDALASSKSSIFLRRIVGVVFMRVNSRCAHQERPPLKPVLMDQMVAGGPEAQIWCGDESLAKKLLAH
jgi:hypothetical protein